MLAVIVVLAVLVIAYMWLDRPIHIIRFYSDSCKYCVNSQAEWDKFCSQTQSGYKIINVNIKSQCPSSRQLVEKYNVTSVPTIIKVTGMGSTTYSGDHTVDAYLKFAGS